MERVVRPRQLGQLIEKASRADDHGGIVPHHHGHPPAGRRGGPRGGGVEYREHRPGDRIPLRLVPGEAAQQPGVARDMLQQVLAQDDRRNPDSLELPRRRLVQGRRVEHDEVGVSRGDGFDVGVEPVADDGDAQRRRGVLAPRGATHDTVAGADGEEQLGGRGGQGNDAPRRGGERDGAARVVGDGDRSCDALLAAAARRDGEQQAGEVGALGQSKIPTPDGAEMGKRLRPMRSATIPPARDLRGGANGDVSWLRAVGSPSRVINTQWP